MAGDGRIAIVTGAGSGIGKASALALMKDGWQVVLSGRRAEPLQETLSQGGGAGLAVASDVTDPASVRDLFKQTTDAYGRLDLLFNNAGVNAPGRSVEELAFEQWRAVVDTILTGSFLCTQEAFKVMKDQKPMGGRIIMNGSISAYTPRPGSAPYTSAKHAITGLTKSASLDGRKYDIAVGQVDVGNALTEMAARMKDGVPQADGSVRPEPLMDVSNVANAVVHMASLPLDANILFLTVMATKMPFVGRG